MPRVCSICKHKKREDIEAAIITGSSLRKVAKMAGCAAPTIARHRDKCMSMELSEAARIEQKKRNQAIAAKEAQESHQETTILAAVSPAGKMLDKIQSLEVEAKEILDMAKQDKSYGAAIQAIDKLAKIHELTLKYAAEAREQEKAVRERELDDRSIIIEIIKTVLEKFPDVMAEFLAECERLNL